MQLQQSNYTLAQFNHESLNMVLDSFMEEYMDQELDYVVNNNTAVGSEPIETSSWDIRYSLSNSQGDGVSISDASLSREDILSLIGDDYVKNLEVEWDTTIEGAEIWANNNHYSHRYTMHVEVESDNGDIIVDASGHNYEPLLETLQDICKQLECIGYDYIDSENENVILEGVFEDFKKVNGIENDDYIHEFNSTTTEPEDTKYTKIWSGGDTILVGLWVELPELETKTRTTEYKVFKR